jgi:hypothetical protein
LRFNEAYSSLYPPERKLMPTKAGGHVLDSATTVLIPISWLVVVALLGWLVPGMTMLGFNRQPSRNTLFSFNALNTSDKTFSVIA